MRAVLTIRKEPVYRREAFEQGLKCVGFALGEFSMPADSSDWLVLWNRKRGADEARADAWEAAGGTVVIAENGYLAQVDKTYYAISVHGHSGSGWFPVGDEDRFSKLGFELKQRHPMQGDDIVVRGQRGIGSALMASPPNWARTTAVQIKQCGVTLPVKVYDHPGDKGKFEKDIAALKNAHSLVIWSSAMGVRALVEGVPVLRMAPHWICGSAVPRTERIGRFHNPSMPLIDERLAALHRMSYGQWHFDEIASGLPFARIIEHRSEAVWP